MPADNADRSRKGPLQRAGSILSSVLDTIEETFSPEARERRAEFHKRVEDELTNGHKFAYRRRKTDRA